MVRAWNENAFADSVLLICCIAALASALIPAAAALAGSAALAADVSTGIKRTTPQAIHLAAALPHLVFILMPPRSGARFAPLWALSRHQDAQKGYHGARKSASTVYRPQPIAIDLDQIVPNNVL